MDTLTAKVYVEASDTSMPDGSPAAYGVMGVLDSTNNNATAIGFFRFPMGPVSRYIVGVLVANSSFSFDSGPAAYLGDMTIEPPNGTVSIHYDSSSKKRHHDLH